MCHEMSFAEMIATINTTDSTDLELTGEQFIRYEELDQKAQNANKPSMIAAYVSKCSVQ